ncbi:MAG: hypothetical protein R3C28_31430 [Pirellulaceae bacterium]
MRQSDSDSAKMKYEQAERQERLLRAQAMSDEDRFLAGARLFDMACRTRLLEFDMRIQNSAKTSCCRF